MDSDSVRFANLRHLSSIANRIQLDLNVFKEILVTELGHYSEKCRQNNDEDHSAANDVEVNLIGIDDGSQQDGIKIDVENIDNSIQSRRVENNEDPVVENLDPVTSTKAEMVQTTTTTTTTNQPSSRQPNLLRSLRLIAKGQKVQNQNTTTTKTARTTTMTMMPKKIISELKPFRQTPTRNVNENTHVLRSKKLAKVLNGSKKLPNVNENTHVLRSKKLATVLNGSEKLTKEVGNGNKKLTKMDAKRSAKTKRAIDIESSLSDSNDVDNVVNDESKNISKEKFEEKLSKKLTKVGNGNKKLTKIDAKRPAKTKRSIDNESSLNLNDSNDVNKAVKDESKNSSKEKFEEKLSNDNGIMESGSGTGNASILSQFSDFVLSMESENQNELELSSAEENIGEIEMNDESKSKGENVLMNSVEEKIEQRADELKYFEDLTKYNWEKDGEMISNSIHCMKKDCKKKYKTKRDFYNHMLAAHWMIFQFKCKYCEKCYGQISTRKTHETTHIKTEKKLVSKANPFKRQRISQTQNDQVNVNIEENSLSLNNPGTSLIDESNVVNTMSSEDLPLNQENATNGGDTDKDDTSNDCKNNGASSEDETNNKRQVEQSKLNLRSRESLLKPFINLFRKHDLMKNVEKCFVVYPTDGDEQKPKMYQCKKCLEILRDVTEIELLDHIYSHAQ